MRNTTAIIVGALLGLAGCAGTSTVEREFGNSVRALRAAQTNDPKPASTAAVEGADPVMVNTAIEAMRKDVADREESGQGGVTVNVGGGQQAPGR
jgi:hypothetical protein